MPNFLGTGNVCFTAENLRQGHYVFSGMVFQTQRPVEGGGAPRYRSILAFRGLSSRTHEGAVLAWTRIVKVSSAEPLYKTFSPTAVTNVSTEDLDTHGVTQHLLALQGLCLPTNHGLWVYPMTDLFHYSKNVLLVRGILAELRFGDANPSRKFLRCLEDTFDYAIVSAVKEDLWLRGDEEMRAALPELSERHAAEQMGRDLMSNLAKI